MAEGCWHVARRLAQLRSTQIISPAKYMNIHKGDNRSAPQLMYVVNVPGVTGHQETCGLCKEQREDYCNLRYFVPWKLSWICLEEERAVPPRNRILSFADWHTGIILELLCDTHGRWGWEMGISTVHINFWPHRKKPWFLHLVTIVILCWSFPAATEGN